MALPPKKKKKKKLFGKKAVYITKYKSAAFKIKEMYERKGENVVVEAERDSIGRPVFVVYILPRGYL